jgi:hypothetical protein
MSRNEIFLTITSVSCINVLRYTMETRCVPFEIGTTFLNVMHCQDLGLVTLRRNINWMIPFIVTLYT